MLFRYSSFATLAAGGTTESFKKSQVIGKKLGDSPIDLFTSFVQKNAVRSILVAEEDEAPLRPGLAGHPSVDIGEAPDGIEAALGHGGGV